MDIDDECCRQYSTMALLESDSSIADDTIRLMDGGDQNASLLSRIFFCWTNDLIRKGYRLQLNNINDLFTLPSSLESDQVEREFIEAASTRFVDDEEFSLTKALFRAFGLQFFALGILKLISDTLTFAGPILLHLLVVCLEDEKCVEDGYNYSLLMMIATFFSAITSANFNFYISKIGLKIRSAISTAVYDKLLRVSLSTLSAFSSGQILNFMSTDIDRIVNFCGSFHAFWSLPLQLGIALYLLYREVGLAFLSGLVASLLLLPINKWITSAIGRLSTKMMHCKDQRVKLISETVHSIRTVKLSNWEAELERRILSLRQKEIHYLKGRKYLDAICVYLWASAPILITISIFATYTMVLHERLTAAKVFTSLALVNILIMPLNNFPWVLSGLIESFVSIKRLNRFFELDNIDIATLYSLTTDSSQPLQISDAKFSWRSGFSLNNVTISGNAGTVIGLIGSVGCGKSTFLLGILGETDVLANRIGIRQSTVRNGFAYVSQNCWLKRGTLRENIVCDSQFDEPFYAEVIRCTALKTDIQAMPGGDEYEIGDGGCTLSGGQRARVALARALYQNREIYLLDDPFASVDMKVGTWIWNEAIIRMLRSRGKLVIIATHHINFLKDADHILVLDSSGNITKQGTPSVILAESEFEVQSSKAFDSLEESPESDENVEQVMMLDEEKQRGKVRLSVYGAYMSATGVFLSLVVLLSVALMQLSKNVSDWWLSQWTSQYNNISNVTDPKFDSSADFNLNRHFVESHSNVLITSPTVINGASVNSFYDYTYPFGSRSILRLNDEDYDQTMYFLMVFAGLAFCNTLFTLIRAFLFAYGGIVAAKNLHNRLLHRVLNAALSWLDRTPSGRVINRLCADVYIVDDSLPFQLNILLACSFNLIGSIVLTFIALPFLSPVLLALFIIYYLIQRYYRYTTCDVKRLTSLSLSPLYSHLSDTINGLSTIRAFRFVDHFCLTLRKRLNDNIRSQFSSLAASQWLSIRLQILGVCMVSAVTLSAVLHRTFHYVDSALVGLAITYALSMTNLLNALLNSFIETEKELISVERIAEYIEDTPQESNNFPIPITPNIRGRIDFACVSLRYGYGLPLALENVSFQIEAGSRVAITGRTGSGKSSLIQALLRANPIDSGRIFIDGIDIASVELHSLRAIFGIVTQSPFVFSGTLRDNLCLGHHFSDQQLKVITSIANFAILSQRLGGIDGVIEEGGANLSFGEKQIISICRLILHRPKIVIFDEATAHMDSETHTNITNIVRNLLPSVTAISILHRMNDIASYDSVIRLDSGKIVWQGPPSQLD
ncbi:unnamed protein product [Anisakis simplex]|uniref:ABC-type xenobiotic transporter n=1 Tax=Anisakis simplex TaxID=6269 RepID=A0A158PN75_ANISI|nr:unnamed protein product [Anisakis simplex]